jgi:RNA polymerase sigma-70 factor (ECF subfamily)
MLAVDEIEAAYRRHGHSVLRRARRILGDEQEAREVLQEIFTSLLDRPAQFQGRSSLLTWLYSATTHLALNRLRNARNQARLRDLYLGPGRGAAMGAAAPIAEDRMVVLQLLSRVPSELAEVAVYYYFDELSHAEIAELLGCSRRHVGDLIVRFQEQAKGQELAS